MNRIEELMHEYYFLTYGILDQRLKLKGLIIENTIYLNQYLNDRERYVTLAEEIGHWETTSNKNITDYKLNSKEELIAREWSFKKIVPVEDLKKFESKDTITDYEVAEDLDLPINVVREACSMYKRKGAL